LLKTEGDNLYIFPEGLPANIKSITTTKHSSIISYNYLSQSNKKYRINHKDLKEGLGIDNIFIPNQIHSNKVQIIDFVKNMRDYECDGFVTSIPDLALGILTADCFVVQLYSKNLIANLHCGWKSIYSGIIENAIKIFDKLGEEVRGAVVGPGICEDCYQVGEDIIDMFVSKYGVHHMYKIYGNSHFLSLRKVIEIILKDYGIYNIIDLNYCPSCKSYLYSYRRDRGHTGRMLSILIKKI